MCVIERQDSYWLITHLGSTHHWLHGTTPGGLDAIFLFTSRERATAFQQVAIQKLGAPDGKLGVTRTDRPSLVDHLAPRHTKGLQEVVVDPDSESYAGKVVRIPLLMIELSD